MKKLASKLVSLFRRAPKRTSATLAMIAAAIIVPATIYAYGPTRATFTGASPAPYVTFDSITDNPQVGDERNFVRIKDASDTNATYTDNANLTAGHTYDVMVYYHNDAASNLNASGVGIAKDVALRMQMAASVGASSSTEVTGFIDSSNANPKEVYDSATLTNQSAGSMDLAFVSNSAKVTSNGAVNGATLPDSVFTTGTPLGYDALNGTLPGCNQYAGYVIFQVTANQPNFTVTKQVQKTGETTWNKTEAVNPGDSVDYLITYKNTGSTQQNNVVIDDELPKGITYKDGTTYVANSTNPKGLLLDSKSDTITNGGINIGNYSPGAAAYVKFTATVASNDNLATCGANLLTNTALGETGNGNKSDTASVTVNKTCTTPTPTYTCNALTSSLISGGEYSFNGTASAANGATITGYTFDFGDGTTQTVTNPTGVTHTYAQNGETNYVTLTANFDVNGVAKTATSNTCTATITAGKPPVVTPPTTTPPTTTPPTTPTTPTALPETGATLGISAFVGAGALVAAIWYYVSSRRALAR